MTVDNENLADLPREFRTGTVTNFVNNTKPTALAIGDRWYKPVDGSDWFWNGSYWLSTNLFYVRSDYNREEITASKSVSGSVLQGRDLTAGESGIYFVSATVDFYPYTTTTVSDYWLFNHYAYYSDGTIETVASSSGPSKIGDTWNKLKTAINSPKNSLGKSLLLTYCTATEVGTAPNMLCMTELEFRHVHP